LVAYASYLFSNGAQLSGIVSLLFCGITLKHYAYYNMSRRTQLTTKYIFQVLAQLSENFIFIYLGLTLFTDPELKFRPIFILVTTFGICVARWTAVFPLSKLINWVISRRAQARGRQSTTEEIPHSYRAMLFWAGLRGAVGVALAAGLHGENANSLRSTVLVVVVLTVIVFGGTTARMLEILGIRTGVVEEIDSDDEFDIESAGVYFKSSRGGIGSTGSAANITLDNVGQSSYSSSQQRPSPPDRPTSALAGRRSNSSRGQFQQPELLREDNSGDESDASDLPPRARRNTTIGIGISLGGVSQGNGEGGSGSGTGTPRTQDGGLTAVGAITGLAGALRGTTEDQAEWFRRLDEGYIKPKLLLDHDKGNGGPS